MTAKHTPGPWKACRSHEEFNGPMWEIDEDEIEHFNSKPFVKIEAESGLVASAHDLFEFKPANARLIAAAPDLLKELQELVEAYEDGEPNWKQIVSSAHAAIAKATGEQA